MKGHNYTTPCTRKFDSVCRDGTISLSVHCVQSVMMSCEKNQEQLHILKQYFDTKSMQDALYSLCDQLEGRPFHEELKFRILGHLYKKDANIQGMH